MYRIEWERIDGRIGYWTGADKLTKVYEDVNEAESMSEWLWNTQTGAGVFARFSVIDENDEVYSELECD